MPRNKKLNEYLRVSDELVPSRKADMSRGINNFVVEEGEVSRKFGSTELLDFIPPDESKFYSDKRNESLFL